MSSEYNSKLISNLYSSTDEALATEIADQMVEIKDPVFVRPIFDAYLKFKNTSRSHYFLSDMSNFEGDDALHCLLDVALDHRTPDSVWVFTLGGLIKNGYVNDPQILARVENILVKSINTTRDILSYYIVLYLTHESVVLTEGLIQRLKFIFTDDYYNKENKKQAFEILLKKNPEKILTELISDFDSLTEDTIIVLTEVILKWNGVLASNLISLIKNSRNEYAKELIVRKEEKEKDKEEELKEKEQILFPNTRCVEDIREVREQINITFLKKFNSKIFAPSELIFRQIKSVETKESLVSFSIDLRSIVQDFTEIIKSHGLSFEEAKGVVNGISEEGMSQSINGLNLYLHSKGVKVDTSVYGLRPLNRVLTCLAHPEKEKELVALLSELNLFQLYQKGDFSTLHAELLKLYKKFLDGFLSELNLES